MRRIFSFLLALCLLAGTHSFARAQTTSYAEISGIDPSNFPKVGALLDVFGANGEFITGLQTADVKLSEDGEARPVETLTQSSVPAQVSGPVTWTESMKTRDGSSQVEYRIRYGVAVGSFEISGASRWLAACEPVGARLTVRTLMARTSTKMVPKMDFLLDIAYYSLGKTNPKQVSRSVVLPEFDR